MTPTAEMTMSHSQVESQLLRQHLALSLIRKKSNETENFHSFLEVLHIRGNHLWNWLRGCAVYVAIGPLCLQISNPIPT